MKKTIITILAFALTSCSEAPKPTPAPKPEPVPEHKTEPQPIPEHKSSPLGSPSERKTAETEANKTLHLLQGNVDNNDIENLDYQTLIDSVNQAENQLDKLESAQAFSILSRISTLQSGTTAKINDDCLSILYHRLGKKEQEQLQQQIANEYWGEKFNDIFGKSDSSHNVSDIIGVIKLNDDLKGEAFDLVSKAVELIEIKSLHMENIKCVKQLIEDSDYTNNLEDYALYRFIEQYAKEKQNQATDSTDDIVKHFKQFVSIFNLHERFIQSDIELIERGTSYYPTWSAWLRAQPHKHENPIVFSVLNVALEDNVTVEKIQALVGIGADVFLSDKTDEGEPLYPLDLAAIKGRVEVIDLLFRSCIKQGKKEKFQEHAQAILGREDVSSEVKAKLNELLPNHQTEDNP